MEEDLVQLKEELNKKNKDYQQSESTIHDLTTQSNELNKVW